MPSHLPTVRVRASLRKLGADIRAARLRRRLSMKLVSERARTTRVTLTKVEKGDAGVSIGIYCSVLNSLGLLDGVSMLADVAVDAVGVAEQMARTQRGRS